MRMLLILSKGGTYSGYFILWVDKILFFGRIRYRRLEISHKSARMSGIAYKISSQKIIDIERFTANLCFNS